MSRDFDAARGPRTRTILRRATALIIATLVAGAVAPGAANAHGSSGRAGLPVPAWLFAWAAAVVLVISFVLLSTMWPRPRLQDPHERRLCTWASVLSVPAGAIGLALFAVVIYSGYEGVPYYPANVDPTFIYVIFWVAVPVSSLLLGNWFSAFSPWRACARALRWVGARLRVQYRAPFAYPAWLGRLPVVAGLIAFGWLELVYRDHDNPVTLASLSLPYFVLMLVGM